MIFLSIKIILLEIAIIEARFGLAVIICAVGFRPGAQRVLASDREK